MYVSVCLVCARVFVCMFDVCPAVHIYADGGWSPVGEARPGTACSMCVFVADHGCGGVVGGHLSEARPDTAVCVCVCVCRWVVTCL